MIARVLLLATHRAGRSVIRGRCSGRPTGLRGDTHRLGRSRAARNAPGVPLLDFERHQKSRCSDRRDQDGQPRRFPGEDEYQRDPEERCRQQRSTDLPCSTDTIAWPVAGVVKRNRRGVSGSFPIHHLQHAVNGRSARCRWREYGNTVRDPWLPPDRGVDRATVATRCAARRYRVGDGLGRGDGRNAAGLRTDMDSPGHFRSSERRTCSVPCALSQPRACRSESPQAPKLALRPAARPARHRSRLLPVPVPMFWVNVRTSGNSGARRGSDGCPRRTGVWCLGPRELEPGRRHLHLGGLRRLSADRGPFHRVPRTGGLTGPAEAPPSQGHARASRLRRPASVDLATGTGRGSRGGRATPGP
jgi:hypothetical protein